MEFTGEFESHLTVELSETHGIESLQAFATKHGVKCLHILLNRGSSASQPMLTRRGHGTFTREREKAVALGQALQTDGFRVTRIKIEAAPWNEDIPQSKTEALNHPEERHFEHHIKLLLEPDRENTDLVEIAQGHGAHLSRNALKQREDGYQERFITQRCFGVGRPDALLALDALLQALALQGVTILDQEEEFVIFDSNLELDAGWITT